MAVKDFDDILEYVGGFGRYQKLLVTASLPFFIVLTSVYFGQIFFALTPDHWCNVPELSNLSLAQRRNLSIPKDDSHDYAKCRMYNVNYSQVLEQGLLPNSSWPTTSCHWGWEYDLTSDYATIVSELDWVCDDAWRPSFGQSMFFVGCVVGSIILGYLGDQFGRIPALVTANLVACIAGIATAFTQDFFTFVSLRFIMGLTYDNCFMMMYIIMLEYIRSDKRSLAANLPVALFLTVGLVTLPWAAYAIWNWRILTIVLSIPMGLAIFSPLFIPESGRWLISKGKVPQAVKILKRVAKVNRRVVDDSIFEEFYSTSVKLHASEACKKKRTAIELFKTPNMRRRMILLTIIWMIITVVYDGHVRNLSNLNYSLYVTFSLTGLLELPADLFTIVLLEWIGRRWTSCLALILSGLFYLFALSVGADYQGALIGLAAAGRFFITIVVNTGWQYCVELIPTEVRGQGSNLIHISGHAATFFGPMIVLLASYNLMLPFLILGLLAVFGGLLCLLLPETLHHALPQTILEAENFGRDQKFWAMPCISSCSETVHEVVATEVPDGKPSEQLEPFVKPSRL